VKLQLFRQGFEKYSNIRFHETPSSGSRVAPCGQTDRQTDGWKLIVTLRNFANMSINGFKKCYQPRNNFLKDKKCCLFAEAHTNWNGGGIVSASY